MDLAALLKKNIVMIPVVASVLVGTFTGVKYIVNLTDTINANKSEIQAIQTMELENIRRDVAVLTEKTNTSSTTFLTTMIYSVIFPSFTLEKMLQHIQL